MFSSFIKTVPDIIRAGSASTLAILALMIVVAAGMAYAFFRKDQAAIRFRIFLIVLGFLILLVGAVLYGKGVFKGPDATANATPVLTGPSKDDRQAPPEPFKAQVKAVKPDEVLKTPVLRDVEVVVYNGTDVPDFSLNKKPANPIRYSSGIATFRLPEGPYSLRAEYSARTCSAVFSVPAADRVAADCKLK